MSLLIIEDNNIKFSLIQECLDEARIVINRDRCASYQSAIRALVHAAPSYDQAILDMTLPAYDVCNGAVSVNTLTFGGELILREAKRRNVATKFIILTQYDVFLRDKQEISFEELKAEISERHKDSVIDCIKMNTTSSEWKSLLVKNLNSQ
jgi:CheY-like chemotaxis protein